MDILGGETWDAAIRGAIHSSDLILVSFLPVPWTNVAISKGEIRLALDKRQEFLDDDIFLIPVRLEECSVPDALTSFQWVDLFATNGWDKLRNAINARQH